MLAKLSDIGLDSFLRGSVFWEREHVRLVQNIAKGCKGVSQ